MVLDEKQYLKDQAKKMVEFIEKLVEVKRIQNCLSKEDEKISVIPKETLGQELMAAHLALGTLFWEKSCIENAIEDPGSRKYFLRLMTEKFQSPQDVSFASIYSDYLCSPSKDPEEGEIVSVSRRFFDRLNMESASKQRSEETDWEIRPAFQRLVEIFEGFRSEFERMYFELF